MAYSIVIGKIQFNVSELIVEANHAFNDIERHNLKYAMSISPSEGIEPIGLTSAEFTNMSGMPMREPSYIAWANFCESNQHLNDLDKIVRAGNSDGDCYALNTLFVKEKIALIEQEIVNMSMDNQDRAKWLCFWVKKAIELYGNEAAIGFW